MKSTLPLPSPMARKHYKQNHRKYEFIIRRMKCSCLNNMVVCVSHRTLPRYNDISATITIVEKHTIVELIYAGKHYHGLAAKANCDEDSLLGVKIAYNRAFKAMIGVV